MTNNHCQEAFWMGILKNRDLKVVFFFVIISHHHLLYNNMQGQEILSQQPMEDEEEEEMDIEVCMCVCVHNTPLNTPHTLVLIVHSFLRVVMNMLAARALPVQTPLVSFSCISIWLRLDPSFCFTINFRP